VNLGFSLKLAIESKKSKKKRIIIIIMHLCCVFKKDKPMPMNETPTSAHTTLTEVLSDIQEVAMELPLMEPMNKTEAAVALSQNDLQSVQPSYEDG
jgi:hypothetical protein